MWRRGWGVMSFAVLSGYAGLRVALLVPTPAKPSDDSFTGGDETGREGRPPGRFSDQY